MKFPVTRISPAILGLLLATAPMSGADQAVMAAIPSRADSPSRMPVLLGLPAVRKALAITEPQAALLDVIRAEYKAKSGVVSAARLMDDELTAYADRRLARLRTRYNQRVLSVLTPEQTVKFRKMERGIDGGIFLISPSEQEFLGLTAKQKERVAEITAADGAREQAVLAKFRAGKISPLRRDLDLHRIRRSTDRSMLHLLTPAQKSLWVSNLLASKA